MKHGNRLTSEKISAEQPAAPGSVTVSYHDYRGGEWRAVQGAVVEEMAVSLTVNGEIWLSLMCTPVDLEALAVGFLFNEGVIQSMADVASVRACSTLENVDVWLTHTVELPSRWRRTSGCTGGMTSVEESTAVERPEPLLLQDEHTPLCISPEKVLSLVKGLFDRQDLYRQVGGVHTSALSDGETIRILADDIGRHNTLDKIAGHCLLEGVAFQPRILITTGRVSSEMMQKASRIDAPIVITRTSPSSLSVQMAEQKGITLIGYARRECFKVYTHAVRILAATEAPCQTVREETQVNVEEDNEINL